MKISKPYYVSRENTTYDEPRSGWYFYVDYDDDEGFADELHGPYSSKLIVESKIDELEEK